MEKTGESTALIPASLTGLPFDLGLWHVVGVLWFVFLVGIGLAILFAQRTKHKSETGLAKSGARFKTYGTENPDGPNAREENPLVMRPRRRGIWWRFGRY